MLHLVRFAMVGSSHCKFLLQTSRVIVIKERVCIRDKRFLAISILARNTSSNSNGDGKGVEGVGARKTRRMKKVASKDNVEEERSTVSVRKNDPIKEHARMSKLDTSEEAGHCVLIGSSSGGEVGKSKQEVETAEAGENIDSLEMKKDEAMMQSSSEVDAASEDAEESVFTGPLIPFEGATEQREFVLKKIDDTCEGRFYKFKSETCDYEFPSITTILDGTRDKESASMLFGWKLNQIRIHGYAKHRTNVRNILNTGTNFHKVSVISNCVPPYI